MACVEVASNDTGIHEVERNGAGLYSHEGETGIVAYSDCHYCPVYFRSVLRKQRVAGAGQGILADRWEPGEEWHSHWQRR